MIRKALIRKHYLHSTFVSYLAKHPESPLVKAIPKTWSIDIAFADELDELWTDELYDLGDILDSNQESWFILKPGMSDRGMGVRLFRTKDDLMRIMHGFDDEESGEDEDEDTAQEEREENNPTDVAISQLRHFVIQVCAAECVQFEPRTDFRPS